MMEKAKAPQDRQLLTFAHMIDSELARLVLAHHKVGFAEADHLFGWVSLLTLFHGGYGQVPLLHGGGLRLSGPRAMAEHFDRLAPPDRRLFPTEQPLSSMVEEDWAWFNGGLGRDVAALCYFHMLPNRAEMVDLFARRIPPTEVRLTPAVYPALRWLFERLLQLGGKRMGDVTTRIRMVFDLVSRRGNQHAFLAGDRPTISDLSFAASAAPLVLPPGYDAPVPRFETMPPALQAVAAELQSHPAATRVAVVYAGRVTRKLRAEPDLIG